MGTIEETRINVVRQEDNSVALNLDGWVALQHWLQGMGCVKREMRAGQVTHHFFAEVHCTLRDNYS
jgi:hypothetical protein